MEEFLEELSKPSEAYRGEIFIALMIIGQVDFI